MTTVRKTAKTTVTLIVFAIGLVLLIRWCGTLSGEFFYKMKSLLNSKTQIGGFHSFLIRLSSRLLLIASGIEVVFREKNGVHALGSFGVPIIFSMCIAWGGLVVFVSIDRATSVQTNILWFWLFYYIVLFICVRNSYSRLSSIKGAGSSKIKLLVQNPPSKNDGDVSIIDRIVLYGAKIVLLVDWFALLIATVVFCIQYKQIFGL